MSKTRQHIKHLCFLGILSVLFLSADAFAQTGVYVHNKTAQVPETQPPAEDAQPEMPAKYEIASLSFPWNQPVNMAVFKRENKLWIVFDHSHTVDLDELRKTADGFATDIFQLPHPSATIIQMTPDKNLSYFIRREGLLWIVDLIRGARQTPINEVSIITQTDSFQNSYFYIPTEKSGNVINAIDPNIGDIISIAPTGDLGYGINSAYHYPEFDSLATYQGLAFVVKTPDISLNRSNTGFILKARDRSLNISENLDSLRRQELFSQSGADGSSFDITVPAQIMEMTYPTAVDQLKQDIIAAKAEDKNRARLELVKYYIAKGLGTNALFMLHQMQDVNIPEASTDKFHALLGLANFLTYRYQDAVEDFRYGKLPDNKEAVLWSTLASSALAYRPENTVIISSYLSLIRNYPQEIKDRIALIAADNALRAGDDIALQNFIDILKSGEERRLKNRTAEIRYLNAQKLELQGYARNALYEYRETAKMPDQKYSSLARYNYVTLNEKLGGMKVKQAIAELEELRFAWAEPKFKWKLLNQLAQYYIKDYDYYNALKTLKQALPLANEEQKPELMARMVSWFEDVYISNQADSRLPAIKSLALYQDFENLADLSPHKNKIIQKLADRLVAVDLLPRAVLLLNKLLDNPDLTDTDVAKIGARLAIINLFEKQSGSALAILDKTERDNIPLELRSLRRIIRAKTLSDLNLPAEALDLLDDDTSKNALLLKSEIYWNSGQWDKVSDTIKYLVKNPLPEQTLDEEQIGYILDWATALKKSGKETVLVRLRNKFMPYFAKTKYHSVFNILTDYLEVDKIDIKRINDVVNDVQAYSNFAKVYNDSLKDSILK